MRIPALSLLLAVTMVACTDKDSDDDDGDGDGGSGEIVPREGNWYSGQQTVIEDSCGFTDEEKDTGEEDEEPVQLTMGEGNSFTLSDGEVEDWATCTLRPASGAFVCDDQVEETDYNPKGLDAVLTVTQVVSGTFSSDSEGSLEAGIDATCAGADCETVSAYSGVPLPCSVRFTADIYWGE